MLACHASDTGSNPVQTATRINFMSRTIRMKKAPWMWEGTKPWNRCSWLNKGRTKNYKWRGKYDAKQRRRKQNKEEIASNEKNDQQGRASARA